MLDQIKLSGSDVAFRPLAEITPLTEELQAIGRAG